MKTWKQSALCWLPEKTSSPPWGTCTLKCMVKRYRIVLSKPVNMAAAAFTARALIQGWMGDMLPLVMSGICQRLDQVYVQEITNFEFYPSPSVIFDMMGFGRSPEDFDNHSARYTNWLNGLFRESIQMVADGLELELDSITVDSEVEVSAQALKNFCR